MTTEEFDQIPPEDWDFSVLWDTLQTTLRERDEAGAQWRRCGNLATQFKAEWDAATEKLDDAQEAAETYHAAWQDAAVYWKESVKRLEGELLGVYRDRDRLREALKRYGRHESGPDGCRFNPCSCGLSDLVA